MAPPITRVYGGSLTSAMALTLVAWGIRALRGAALMRHLPGVKKRLAKAAMLDSRLAKALGRSPTAKRLAKGAAPLGRAVLRLLVDLAPVPHLVVDVRDADEARREPLPAALREAPHVAHIPEDLLHGALSLKNRQWPAGLAAGPPGRQTLLVFVSSCQRQMRRCAAYATSLGYARVGYLQDSLEAFGALDDPGYAGPWVNRDALALLMGLITGTRKSERVFLVDCRRHDERALYGSIEGSVHVPADHLPRALHFSPEEWLKSYRFPKPGEGDAVVLQCRTNKRAQWAALLCQGAGMDAYVYSQGSYGWHFNEDVKQYASYEEGDAPPEPEPFDLETPDMGKGTRELEALGLSHLLC